MFNILYRDHDTYRDVRKISYSIGVQGQSSGLSYLWHGAGARHLILSHTTNLSPNDANLILAPSGFLAYLEQHGSAMSNCFLVLQILQKILFCEVCFRRKEYCCNNVQQLKVKMSKANHVF